MSTRDNTTPPIPEVMGKFSRATKEWFEGAFADPTPAQLGAWDAISRRENALVIAPTGSGKTLAAFLWTLDSFIKDAAENPAPQLPLELTEPSALTEAKAKQKSSTKVLYISPLKALGVDVERNLRAPLIGITQTARRLNIAVPDITVGVRSGDTPTNERRRLQTNPPNILITTPESLYLMLTSRARETLANVHTVIIDEVHAVAGTKRGAHLAVTLERLDALLKAPAQRIGLSATVEPRTEVARFLGGSRPVTIVAPPSRKTWDLKVTVPVEDMTDLPAAAAAHDLGPASGLQPQASIWPHVEEQIVDLIEANRSTIVFANSRRLAERLTGRLNEIHESRLSGDDVWNPFAPGGVGSTAAEMIGGASNTSATATRNAPTRAPAEMMAQAGATAAIASQDPENGIEQLARAHHGSVSKEQRAQIEDDLKSGRLRCVVATSSLELGIDMGLVDLVIQVEAPTSVASGLQRVGRAGHQVGEVSKGVFFPKHRGDLVNTTVTVERMLGGKIEALKIPANPLDILAQQTVAASALGTVDVEEWFDIVRGSAPFANLPRSAFDATLDLLSGKYPSDEFAELRPRIVWDRDGGTFEGRPGAQRLAVTSGGTIPDRGLFGVFLAGSEDAGTGGRRVGELDEEMVYESRVGDVFALGATSWKIEDITFDRVLVSPAFGQPGKLPFWKGDSLGRPYELGVALGQFQRELVQLSEDDAAARLAEVGLDEWATGNLTRYLADQVEATTAIPSDKTLIVERFQDELGDWRLVLHSPFGMSVHAPWALAVGARLHQRYGLDGSAMAADDGIVLRVPMMDDEPPGAELFFFDSDELEQIVTAEVGGSALFASRFRECAARALLLPRQNPAKRQPLWQQRQRSAQLLDVAKKYPSFPIILETVRECLQDVYDLPALRHVVANIENRKIRVIESQTQQPSPFAQSLLFGYVAQFLYEGDSPLAERRAAALSLDPGLLNDLLGRAELRELLDAGVILQTERELQRLTPDRKLKGIEGIADLLRLLGPLSATEIAERIDWQATSGEPAIDGEGPAPDDSLLASKFVYEAQELATELVRANRAMAVRIGGRDVFAAIEDASRLRDALGVPLPIGVPLAFVEPVADPLGDMVGRYARTHGPFTATEASHHLGLGVAVVNQTLRKLLAEGRLAEGEFRPHGTSGTATVLGDTELSAEDANSTSSSFPSNSTEWCDSEVLRRIRRRSLAALRAEVEPVDPATFGRFLPPWQYVGENLRGSDGVATVLDQLSGVRAPASAWESFILPARVRDYQPALLDELLASGEVLWQGNGSLAGNDGWVSFHVREHAPLTLQRDPEFEPTPLHTAIMDALSLSGAAFFTQLHHQLGPLNTATPPTEQQLLVALWELVWAGRISNDTLAPVRGLLGGGHTAHKQKANPRARSARLGRVRGMRVRGLGAGWQTNSGLRADASMPPNLEQDYSGGITAHSPSAAGRWSLVPQPEQDPTISLHAAAEYLLDRYGVLTRGSVMAEEVPGGFGMMYKVLARMEESGIARRGYFIEKLGAAQFSTPATVDRLRSHVQDADIQKDLTAVALAATDPANPYGAALSWPTVPSADGTASPTGHRPGRKAGGVVVLVNGELTLYVERGGKTLLAFTDHEASLQAAAHELVRALKTARVDKMAMEKVNGLPILDSTIANALLAAGFYSSPAGLRFRS
ncbi:ATP-dependent Lhr-like helicase [Neomicrococcus aestuarii]|uniref:ATP-dependent Lhr-like helicase n=1 Tax=Neomicrococcus aestuarii TaxID=556325 RepID=A0A7W8X034_9MICC|nr:ATP-dependent helicase [Neomicrococcus aestuarii]MBB5512463.1 ATP-dependent Lhr-like helicase [Neomicrococcus aestuarii]